MRQEKYCCPRREAGPLHELQRLSQVPHDIASRTPGRIQSLNRRRQRLAGRHQGEVRRPSLCRGNRGRSGQAGKEGEGCEKSGASEGGESTEGGKRKNSLIFATVSLNGRGDRQRPAHSAHIKRFQKRKNLQKAA